MTKIPRRLRLFPAVLALGSGLLAAAPDPVPPTGGAGVTAFAVPLIQPAAPLATAATAPAVPPTQARIEADYGKLPYTFEANGGQADAAVKFLARGPGYSLFLTPGEAVLSLHTSQPNPTPRPRPGARPGSVPGPTPAAAPEPTAAATPPTVLRLSLVGANPDPVIRGEAALPGKVNYLSGKDPAAWRTGLSTYAKVRYEGVYPGVDLVYYGTQGQLEYDLVLAPGADPKVIRLAFAGADRMRLDDTGSLVLTLGEQQVIQHSPRVYQETNAERTLVPTHYVLADNREVSLAIGDYDAGRALVIDPVLVYSTYLGGSEQDTGYDIAVDGAGNAYLTGLTYSTDFPTRQALQPDGGGSDDVFVAKLSADGAALVYSTYLGGSVGSGIAVDGAGNAYVTGAVGWYDDFPTRNALQPASGGETDAFVAKLSADGATLVYATYLGGLSSDWGKDIAVDSAGNAWVTGNTQSSDFPTQNALQPVFGSRYGRPDAFVAKISADGATLIYSTYLGGLDNDYGNGIAVDDRDDVYVTGITQVFRNDASTFPIRNALQPTFGGYQDAFVTKLSADGATLIYSTYLGGEGGDEGLSIAVDGAGNAYVTGWTWASDFPTRHALQPAYGGEGDAFIAKLSAAGATLVYATYLGGSGDDRGAGIAVDGAGHAYVTGRTYSIDFPTRDVLQPGSGGSGDAFVAKLSADGAALLYSTYLGGSNEEFGNSIAVDGLGNAYAAGSTDSADFPTRKPLRPISSGMADVYIAKISGGKSAPVMAPLRVLSLGDVSGDGTQDIAVVLKEGPAGDLSARIMDAVGGASIRTFRCDQGYALIDLAVVPDQNANGAPELALLGRNAATADMQVEVHDTLSGDRLHAIVFDLVDRTPKRLAVLADPDGGTAQLAVLATALTADGDRYAAMQIRDARTGAWVGDVQFDPDYEYRGFAVVADANGNGAPELAMLGIKKTRFQYGMNKVELRDSSSGLLVRDLWSQTGADPLDLVEVPDAAGVGPSDVAVLERWGAKVVVKTTDTGTAAKVGFVYYTPTFVPHQITVLPDLDGNGVAEVALLGRNADGQTKTELRDVVTGTLVRNLWFEGLAPTDLAVLPDLNGNGSPEVAVLGTTPTGRVRLLIQDVGTKALVSRLTF